MLTKKILDALEPGEVFRVVTTKVHGIQLKKPAELTFVCKKGGGPDWAIYFSFSHMGVEYIVRQGDKVLTEKSIQDICPCDEQAMQMYRF